MHRPPIHGAQLGTPRRCRGVGQPWQLHPSGSEHPKPPSSPDPRWNPSTETIPNTETQYKSLPGTLAPYPEMVSAPLLHKQPGEGPRLPSSDASAEAARTAERWPGLAAPLPPRAGVISAAKGKAALRGEQRLRRSPAGWSAGLLLLRAIFRSGVLYGTGWAGRTSPASAARAARGAVFGMLGGSSAPNFAVPCSTH